jgi:hypothetical protein
MEITIAKSRGVFFAMVAAAGLTLSGISSGFAQEKQKYYFKSLPGLAKYTQQHVIDVGDVPGHQIRVYELHTKFGADAPSYDGIKVAEVWTRAMSDYTNGSGRNSGYGVSLMANGDKIFSLIEVMSQTTVGADGSRKTKFYNVNRLNGGTGKFKGIRGTLVGSGATDFKTGTSDTITEGEYWIEK